MGFGVAVVVGPLAQFALASDADGAGVQRALTDGPSDLVIQLGDEVLGGGAGLDLTLAHHDVDSVPESQFASVVGRALAHVGDRRRDPLAVSGHMR
jgi:hypothetical protein